METNSSNVDSLLGTNCMVTGNVGETAGGDPNVAETGGVNSKAATDNNSIKSKNEKPKKANSGNQSTRANEAKSSSGNKPVSPPSEVRTISRLTLKEIYKHSRKMNAKIMPNFENDSVGGKMNFAVYLSNSGEHDQRSTDASDCEQVNDDARIQNNEILNDVNADKCQPNRTNQTSLYPDFSVSHHDDQHSKTIRELQPILKPVQQPPVGEWIEIRNQQAAPSNELNLSLKSTLHHALKSNYAYLSFQDSFNIQDYQSFDSGTSSIKKLANQPKPYPNSLDASFSTSLDTIEIVRQLENNPEQPEIGLSSGKQLNPQVLQQASIDSQTINKSKSSQSIRDLEEGLSTRKESIKVEETAKVVETMTDNYLYNESDKRKIQFRSFVDAIRIIKNWATGNKPQLEGPIEDFNFKMLSKPVGDEKQLKFLCFGNLVVDSNKPAYYRWLIVISFAILYNLLMIVGRSTFWELQNNWTSTWIFLDYFCDFVYLIDIAVNARTAYLEGGLVVRESSKLWKNYYHSLSFKLDVISSLPTDLYFFYSGLFCDFSIPCSVIVRLNRLVKIYRLVECFDKIETRTNYPNAFRISKMIFIILVVIHWNGCLYFYVSYLIGFSIDKWTFNLTANPLFSDQYIYCFYWSTLTLTAIGEVPLPTNDVEYLFVTFNFLIGVLIFATIVGNVGSMITNMNQSRAEFQAKMDSVKGYMEFRRISKALENRVIKWFDYQWQNKQNLDEESVLSVLPDKLKTEIAIHVHLGTLEKVKLFEGVDHRLLEQLVLKLRLQVFSPGDYICRKGDVGKEMYIVRKGRLSVVSEDGSITFANLTDGAVFGELSVLNIQGNKTGNRRSANVRSVGYSDLFCLSKLDLMQVLEEYPEAKEMLIERGKAILRKDGLLDEEKLRAEEQTKENLMMRFEQIMGKYDHMSQKFARFIAEYSVSQRKLKQRIYQLEKSLQNSATSALNQDQENEKPNEGTTEEVNQAIGRTTANDRETGNQERN